jgi:hypothetical protein
MERANASYLPPVEGKSPASATGSRVADQFSLVQGGLIYRFQLAIHMAMPNRSGVAKRAFLTTLVTWLPLLLLSLLQGRALGSQVQIPFLHDFSVSIRFLVALPLLVIAEAIIDPRLNHAVRHFVKSGLVPAEQLPAFEEVILKVNKLRDSFLPAILILIAAFVPSIWYRETEFLRNGVSTWHTVTSPSGESLSLAGWWFGFISLPLYRVLLFRWVWMISLWAIFLRKVSKVDLGCIATHPDTCGGFGFLVEAHLLFGIIGFAGSAVLAGSFGNAIAYEGATVSSLKFLMIASCILAVVLLAAPLLVLTPKLMQTKRRGTYEYGALGTAYTRAFDAKWVQGLRLEQETLLGTSDIQSLADMDNSFSVIREMKVVLVDKKVLIGLAIPAILPMIPLIMIATPADQVVRAVLKLLV